jgi:hypothetical protein
MGRHAQRDRVETRGRKLGDRAAGSFRHHQGQRSRPERVGKPLRRRIENAKPAGGSRFLHMRNQRIEGRPPLRRIEARDGLGVGCIGAQPVDGLGRECDEPPAAQDASRFRNRRRAGRHDPRFDRLQCRSFAARVSGR